MKKILLGLCSLTLLSFGMSCKKAEFVSEKKVEPSDAVKAKISALGLTSTGSYVTEGGYIAEGDIFLDDAMLNSVPEHKTMVVAKEEQYRTTNLVTGLPRNIKISTSGAISTALSAGINAAIARYNAENLQITMSRVASGGNIVIRVVTGAQYIASAGFPSGGNPFNSIKYNKTYQNYSAGFITTVMAHEIGHCIGFRHTDYANRAYSCGGAVSNEGASTVGAVYIPGTPTGADPNSWMLACLGATTDRPFNANDKIALGFVY